MANKGRLIDALVADANRRDVFVRDLTARQIHDVTRTWKKDPNRTIDEGAEPQAPEVPLPDAGDKAEGDGGEDEGKGKDEGYRGVRRS